MEELCVRESQLQRMVPSMRMCELKGVERLATRHLLHTNHRRPGQRSPEPCSDHLVQRTEAQRLHLQTLRAVTVR